MILLRLNNCRRLSGYLGKSCLVIAIDSIAWIAKMMCWGHGAVPLPPKHRITACNEGGCVRKEYRGRKREDRIIQEVGRGCAVQDLSLRGLKLSTVLRISLAYR